MLAITDEAIKFVHEQENFKKAAVVVFEKTYNSWCGPSTYIGVQVYEEAELENYKELQRIKDNTQDFQIYVDTDLYAKLGGKGSINISGFGPFKRLALER